ncbi:hypothetical protein Syun_001653 [Stephania yunnanensis]|uniref:Uncharacterized protein n=1 Tax=Stephania yunnanensis TaxID=152371 RepID=A0AAP0LE80_9MAGN
MAETTIRAGKVGISASPEDRSTLPVDESPLHRASSIMEEVRSKHYSHETFHHGIGSSPSVGKSSLAT